MSDIDDLIAQTAERYNLDPTIFRRQLQTESQLNPNAVNPRSGAAGIAQFMPATAQGLGINPMDPAQAIPAAGLYMRQHLNRFGGDYTHALAAYNWGPGNVAKFGVANLPAETRNYISTITGSSPLPSGGPSPPVPVAAMPAAPDPDQQPGPALAPPGPPPDPGVPTLADMFQMASRRARGLA